MPLKRKRSSNILPPSKRTREDEETEDQDRTNNPPGGAEDTTLADDEYLVKEIIDERKRNGKVEYLIDWEIDYRKDPKGKVYDPDWTTKDLVHIIPRRAWRAKLRAAGGYKAWVRQQSEVKKQESKKGRGRPKKNEAPIATPAPILTATTPEQIAPKRAQGRPRKSTALPQNLAPTSKASTLEPEITAEPGSDHDEDEESIPAVQDQRRKRRPLVEDSSPDPEEGQSAPIQTIPETADSPSEILQADLAAAASSGASNIRVNIPQASKSSKAEFAGFSSSPFKASEVISGTAPQATDESATAPSQPDLIDAGAALDLTQQHSEYEGDTSKSTNDTTGSGAITGSSTTHLASDQVTTQKGAVIPDSQSQLDSASFVPSTQEASGSKTTSGLETQSETDPTGAAPELNRSSGPVEQVAIEGNQAVPQSSAPQPVTQDNSVHGDTTTASAIELAQHVERGKNRITTCLVQTRK